jgi:sec-independent protein translocase protein TatA
MFGNLGFGELMIIMVIVLVLFGAKRVPEISASFGKGIREFKRNMSDIETSVTSSITAEPTRAALPWEPPPAAHSEPSSDPVASANLDLEREPKRLL